MDCCEREESRRQARPSFLKLVFMFHLPGDEWLLPGKQLLPGHHGQRSTQHSSSIPAHELHPSKLVAARSRTERKVKEGGSAHSPLMQAGHWLSEQPEDPLSLHDFNILYSSWGGYQEQN